MRIRSTLLAPCLASFSLAILLSGCSMTETASPNLDQGMTIKGNVHGGQQPVVGAHVYLMAANTTGYGQPSLSLLQAGSTGQGDSVGGYVLTGSDGSFSIFGDYSCTSGTQVYVYALGGNPGAGANSAAGFLAALGQCPTSGSFAAPDPFIFVNEVSTVAAAYSMAGYAIDATHVSSSGSALAQTGISNAFGNAANLAGIATGVAFAATPLGNGIVPQTTINTIANILASCINSNGPTSAPCTTLFANAQSAGSSGTVPTDTATAAINIAHNPGSNVTALFGLASPAAAFSPALTSAPNDYTIGIVFSGTGATGAGLNAPIAVAIDAQGNAWIVNSGNNSISKLSANGAPLSPPTGFIGGQQITPTSIAIDGQGQAWVSDGTSNNLTEYSNAGVPIGTFSGGGLTAGASPTGVAISGTGTIWVSNLGTFSNPGSVSLFNSSGVALSPSTGFTAGGISNPTSLAVDTLAAVWITNQGPGTGNASLTKLGNNGTAGSPSTGFLGGGLNNPQSVAIDAFGNPWVANFGGNSLSEFSNLGSPYSPANGFTGGGLSKPFSVVIDGSNTVWAANYGNSTVSEFSSTGVAISPATGLGSAYLSGSYGSAIDGAGSLWVANNNASSITQLIGIATPVVTPLSAGAQAKTLATRP